MAEDDLPRGAAKDPQQPAEIDDLVILLFFSTLKELLRCSILEQRLTYYSLTNYYLPTMPFNSITFFLTIKKPFIALLLLTPLSNRRVRIRM